MIKFKGRLSLSFIQYNPKKPIKWELKAFVLVNSATGYVWNWMLYTGKMNTCTCTVSPNAYIIFIGKGDSLELDGKGLGHAVVLKLLEGLEDRGLRVYLDNWYSSPVLFDDLHSKGFGACGTLRLNRKGLPQVIKGNGKGKMKNHTMVSATAGKSLAMVWMDKRAVAMLSTIHDSSMVPIKRRSGEATGGWKLLQNHFALTTVQPFYEWS